MPFRCKHIAAAVFAVFGAAAVAQEATPDTWMNVGAVKSRAQVQAELAQARADGTIKATSLGYLPRIESTKTRQQVRAELLAARASGEYAAINAEASMHVPVLDPVLAQSR
jgi:hypothetical protein